MAVSRRVGLSVVFAAAAGVFMLQDSFVYFLCGCFATQARMLSEVSLLGFAPPLGAWILWFARKFGF